MSGLSIFEMNVGHAALWELGDAYDVMVGPMQGRDEFIRRAANEFARLRRKIGDDLRAERRLHELFNVLRLVIPLASRDPRISPDQLCDLAWFIFERGSNDRSFNDMRDAA